MEAYYFKNNDGTFYIGRVIQKYKSYDLDSKKKRVPWLVIVNYETNKVIFNWPKKKLKADPVSKERLVELGLIEKKNTPKSFLCKIFCLH